MKKILFILLILCFSLTIISCGVEEEEATDTTSTVLAEITAVTTPTNDSTPNYTFSSDETGYISYGGSCSSIITVATSGNNTITLVSSSDEDSLSDGTYSDCTITVNDVTLNISSFVIDTTEPTVGQVTSVTTPTTDTTPNYTFSSDEAGTITYGGSCSSSTTTAESGNNTITLLPLSTGTYSDCTITVTDTSGNTSSTLTMNLFSVGVEMGGSIQSGSTLSLSNTVSTLAGSGSSGYANGTGTSASFYNPAGITTDGTNLYVADHFYATIRRIVISTGVVTDLAGFVCGFRNATGTSARFCGTSELATDGTNLFVADYYNHSIRKVIISSGAVTTLAGTDSSGSANGTGTSARFYKPYGITTDGKNVYVADSYNHLIRKIVISTGVVTTIAGTGSSGSDNGTGTSASFNLPAGITTDGTNLFVTDYNNHSIRQIVIDNGTVTTLAGTGSSGNANGTGQSASFSKPIGITTDGTKLYVSDYSNHLIRQIVISTGVVTTLAGTGTSGSYNGTGKQAYFNSPRGITSDGTNLYVSDYGNDLIRQIE